MLRFLKISLMLILLHNGLYGKRNYNCMDVCDAIFCLAENVKKIKFQNKNQKSILDARIVLIKLGSLFSSLYYPRVIYTKTKEDRPHILDYHAAIIAYDINNDGNYNGDFLKKS